MLFSTLFRLALAKGRSTGKPFFFFNTKISIPCINYSWSMLFILAATSLDCTDIYAHEEEYVRDNCSQQSEKWLSGKQTDFCELVLLLCTARFSVHNLLYVMLSRLIFFLLRGKINCKERAENLFSYWLGRTECQDGGGQLWGKAGRPAAFCLSHALLHRVCDKTSLQEYWANTVSLSLGSTLFPARTVAKNCHTSNTASASFPKLNSYFLVASKIYRKFTNRNSTHVMSSRNNIWNNRMTLSQSRGGEKTWLYLAKPGLTGILNRVDSGTPIILII